MFEYTIIIIVIILLFLCLRGADVSVPWFIRNRYVVVAIKIIQSGQHLVPCN